MKIAVDVLFGVYSATGLIGLISMKDPRRARSHGRWCAVTVLSFLVAAYAGSADRISKLAADVGLSWLAMAAIGTGSIIGVLAAGAAVFVPFAMWVNGAFRISREQGALKDSGSRTLNRRTRYAVI
ncbi:hypothetical protein [Paraburkholderia youngii]|uniref:hypothetical protein n=1 Tax=Paraburkholderia youngii TaxID=2782701 RepID=UPI003D1FBAEA